jgi:hypothetical protein
MDDFTLIWLLSADCDPAAYQIMRRHYSFHDYADGRRHRLSNPNRYSFVGPGEKMVLVTPTYDALFVWRKFIDDSGQTGVNCAVFHNESKRRASEMILAAEEIAWRRWPGLRLYTYVDGAKIAFRGRAPGWCFRKAGWSECGSTKKGLIILEKIPNEKY